MGEFRIYMVKVKREIKGLRDHIVPGLEIMKGYVGKLHKQLTALEGEVREVQKDKVEDKVDQQGKKRSSFLTDVKKVTEISVPYFLYVINTQREFGGTYSC